MIDSIIKNASIPKIPVPPPVESLTNQNKIFNWISLLPTVGDFRDNVKRAFYSGLEMDVESDLTLARGNPRECQLMIDKWMGDLSVIHSNILMEYPMIFIPKIVEGKLTISANSGNLEIQIRRLGYINKGIPIATIFTDEKRGGQGDGNIEPPPSIGKSGREDAIYWFNDKMNE